jgi:hypothetical protein
MLLLIACGVFGFADYRRHRAQVEEAHRDTVTALKEEEREEHMRKALENRVAETGSFLAGDPGLYNIPNKITEFVSVRRLPDGSIELTDEWIKENIVMVDIPELGDRGRVQFYKGGVDQLKAVFAEIKRKGLLDKVISVDYSITPPAGAVIKSFKHPDDISPHSLGIAIDINKSYNPPGRTPPGSGEKGSVLDLKPIFESHGFGWGGVVDPSLFQIKDLNKTAGES